MCASAGALLAGQNTDVLGAVAKKRETFLVEGGEYKLALAAFRENFTGLGIDDLCVEVVLIDVHAGLLFTLEGDAGAGGLCQAVNIIRLDSETLLNASSHLLGPGLRAEDTGLELVVFRLVAALSEGLAQISRIGRSEVF